MRGSKPLPFSELPPETFQLPLFSSRMHAGFPSPAEDHIEQNIDLNQYLARQADQKISIYEGFPRIAFW
jgi:SOS-response transcriptional repressor LexA